MRKCHQKTVETSFPRADRGETAVELCIHHKKWGGFAFSSLSDPQVRQAASNTLTVETLTERQIRDARNRDIPHVRERPVAA
jgi:hypothetical protein